MGDVGEEGKSYKQIKETRDETEKPVAVDLFIV